ncbi:MAG TPA: hypothetical protein VGP85_07755 [Pyrinomonadaceae bacterium]|nr:hypothetical protein [Pyrinomonadaceae bacterium]
MVRRLLCGVVRIAVMEHGTPDGVQHLDSCAIYKHATPIGVRTS